MSGCVLKNSEMTGEPLRIFLTDDHNVFRHGIAVLMENSKEFEVAGQAANAREMLEKLPHTQVDVLLLDIDMPEMNGLEAMPIIRKNFPDLNVLVFSMYEDEQHALTMLRNGAKGYILKSTRWNELVTAIRTVAAGDTFLASEISSSLLKALTNNDHHAEQLPNPDVPLTDREVEVLKLVAKGMTNQQISERMNISPRTVDTHRRHIMEKLDLHNAAALSHYASKSGLLD